MEGVSEGRNERGVREPKEFEEIAGKRFEGKKEGLNYRDRRKLKPTCMNKKRRMFEREQHGAKFRH